MEEYVKSESILKLQQIKKNNYYLYKGNWGKIIVKLHYLT